MDAQALWLTIKLATLTTAFLMVLTVALAGWLTLSHSKLRAVIQATANLPLLLPPTVLGFYLLVLLGPGTAVGRFLILIFGRPLAFSFSGLLIGSILYSLPFALQPLIAGFLAVPSNLIEAAQMLGAGRARILFRVILPQSRTPVLTSILFAFLHTVGEFGVVLMIGGNIPGVTRTLSISIFDQVQSFDYRPAALTCAVLTTVSFLALLLLYSVTSRPQQAGQS